MKGSGGAVAGGGFLGLLLLGVLVALRGDFHLSYLVVVAAGVGGALFVQHLLAAPPAEAAAAPIDPAALGAAREALAKALASAVDARMDAALAVAKIAAGSAREGDRLASLAEELRASAERLRCDLDSISRILNEDGVQR